MKFDPTEAVKRVPALSQRHRQILVAIGECKSNKEIASEFGTGFFTVANQRSELYRRLGIHTELEAVRVAVAAGLV